MKKTFVSIAIILARYGYQVTIFDSRDKIGGIMRYGIPDYAGHKAVLDEEVETLKACVETQGGDSTYLDCTDKFPKAKYSFDIVAESDGYITKMDSERIGIAACMLGAGRKTANDTIDFAAGLKILKKTGSKVCKGDILATLYTNDEALFTPAAKEYTAAVTLGSECPEVLPIIISTVR